MMKRCTAQQILLLLWITGKSILYNLASLIGIIWCFVFSIFSKLIFLFSYILLYLVVVSLPKIKSGFILIKYFFVFYSVCCQITIFWKILFAEYFVRKRSQTHHKRVIHSTVATIVNQWSARSDSLSFTTVDFRIIKNWKKFLVRTHEVGKRNHLALK